MAGDAVPDSIRLKIQGLVGYSGLVRPHPTPARPFRRRYIGSYIDKYFGPGISWQRTRRRCHRRRRKAGSNPPKVVTPKHSEHETTTEQPGVFEVVFVNTLMQTANIRLIDGTAHVVPNVPWTALTPAAKK